MENSCYKEYLTNRFAKEKYADFILKISEMIFGAILTSILSVSAIYLIFPSTGASVPLWVIVTLDIVGILAAIGLLVFSLKEYQALGDVSDSNTIVMPNDSLPSEHGMCKEINISSTGSVNFSINCSATKISICIEPTSKEI